MLILYQNLSNYRSKVFKTQYLFYIHDMNNGFYSDELIEQFESRCRETVTTLMEIL